MKGERTSTAVERRGSDGLGLRDYERETACLTGYKFLREGTRIVFLFRKTDWETDYETSGGRRDGMELMV